MIRFSFLSLIAIVAFSLSSCYEDSLIDTTTTTTSTAGVRYVHDIIGVVLDAEGIGIDNAEISIGEVVTFADDNGNFALRNVEISEEGAFIGASQTGYVTAGTAVYPSSSLMTRATIVLLEESVETNLNSTIGGIVEGQDGLKLSFEPNSITKNGAPYDGEVFVSLLQLDIPRLDPTLHTLRAYDIKSSDVNSKEVLSPLLEIEVTLRDAQGELLNVSESLPVMATLPLPDEFQNNTSLSLYSFDAVDGKWLYESEALVTGSEVIVEFNHFTWWALGVPSESVIACLTFNATDGDPSPNDFFTISSDDIFYYVYGEIIYDEELCVPVPADASVTVKSYSYCLIEKGEVELNISNGSGQKFTIDVEQLFNMIVVKGDIKDCNGNLIDDEVQVGVKGTYRYASTQTFVGSYDLLLDECVDISTSELVFFNVATQQIVEIDLANLLEGTNVRDVILCNDGGKSTFIEVNGLAFADCLARQNPEETLLNLEDDERTFIGFDGKEEGSFSCRIGNGGRFYEGTTVVSTYGAVGGYIEGTFSVSELGDPNRLLSGSFVAKRTK